ncbi:MAG: molecular chaperone TorD family protein [Eggerthellaceae bacterium]|nr:molecular chaperone TorD family protein [Eggerthellaceae bacterium]
MDDKLFAFAQVNREFAYRYLWRFFAMEPDEAMLNLIAGDVAGSQLGILLDAESDGMKAQTRLAGLARDYLEGEGGGLAHLRDEFTRLFLGPAAPIAPLWESVYLDNDHLLFSRTTLEIRELYKTAGFAAGAAPKEADDHLAIELDFMAALAKRTAEALSAGDRALASAYTVYQKAFLEQHLTRFVPQIIEQLDAKIPDDYGDFYCYALILVREVTGADMLVLTQMRQNGGGAPADPPTR